MRTVLLLALPGCFLFRGGEGPQCPSDRTVVLALQDDVAALATCKRLSGVTIRTGATIDLSPLHGLEEITGDLSVGPTVGIDEVAFNDLQHVGGAIHVADNGSLRGLFLPRLERAGRIEVDGNVSLNTIAMPNLIEVSGSLVITDDFDLELLDANALGGVGKELVISGDPKLKLVELAHFQRAQTIRIDAPKLAPEVVEQLRAKTATP